MVDDPNIATIEAAAEYLNEGWDGKWPSHTESMKIAYYMVASRHDSDAQQRADALVKGWMAEARKRWKEGFCAFPGGEPIRRT